MIATLMIYCFSVAALVSVAAFAIERAVVALGWPRRAVWIAALIASICLPLIMMTSESSVETPIDMAPVGAAFDAAPIASGAATPEVVISSRPALDTVLKSAWLFASAGLVLFTIVGWIRLSYSARSWQTEMVDGVSLRVTENMGPAVFGYISPEIVVPRWLLAAPEADRHAVVAHEQSHIAANDTSFLLLGLLLVAITPWNLPMWWQLRRLRFAIEVDCDQRVVRDGISVATYGEMLITVAQRHTRTPIGAMAITENSSQLERRIRIMTSEARRNAKLLILGPLAMSVTFVAVAAQLDAPPLSVVTPRLFESRVSTYEAPQPAIPASDETIQPVIAAAPAQVAAPSPALRMAKATTKKPEVDSVATVTAKNAVDATELPKTHHASSQSTTQEATELNRPLKRLKVVRPEHPVAALRDSITGWVEVAFTVNVSGEVVEAEVRSSKPEGIFDEAALTSIRQWSFEPALKDGQPVPTRTMVRLNFSAPPDPNRKSEAINLKFVDIPTREVLSLLGKTRGQNMIIDDRVNGTTTVNLQNVPWDEALDYILRSKNLVKRQQGESIVIEPAPDNSPP